MRSVADVEACERAVDDAEVVYHLAGQVRSPPRSLILVMTSR